MYDYSAFDGPKGIGFPLAFYIGGGGLCYSEVTKTGVVCPFNFDYKIFVIDIVIWIIISLALSFSIFWVYDKYKKKKQIKTRIV